MGNIIFLTTAIGGRPILAMNFDGKAASTIPILMNTSNCDLREVFNWGSPPMRERSRGSETKRKRVRGGGGGRWSKDRRAWFFSIADRHYRRSSWRTTLVSCHTLIFAITSRRPRAPIFAKKLSTGTDRPLRAFGTIDKESNASWPMRRGTEERDLVNFVSLLVHLWSAWSLRISLDDLGEVNSSTVTTLHQIAHLGFLSPFYILVGDYHSRCEYRETDNRPLTSSDACRKKKCVKENRSNIP